MSVSRWPYANTSIVHFGYHQLIQERWLFQLRCGSYAQQQNSRVLIASKYAKNCNDGKAYLSLVRVVHTYQIPEIRVSSTWPMPRTAAGTPKFHGEAQ